MTGTRANTTGRAGPSGASRFLSLWSDSALEQVEHRPAPRRRAPARRAAPAPRARSTRSTTGRAPGARSTTGRASGARTATTRTATTRATTTATRATAGRSTGRSTTAARSTSPTRTGSRSAPAGRTSLDYGDRRDARRDRSSGAPAGRSRAGTSSGRPSSAAARTGGSRTGTTTRRATTPTRAGAEVPSGFRSRRSGGSRSQGRSTTKAKRSTRRSHPPVTEVGERTAAYLTATVLGLTLFGLVMVLSASSVSSLHQLADSPFFQFKRQAMWAGLGAVAFVISSRLDYRRLRPLAGPLLLITLAMLVALLIPGLGTTENGSTRWLGVGPIVIQPSEVAKLVLIVFVADLLARRERRMDRPELTVRPVMLVLVLVSGLIVVQPKLGTPIILAAVTMLMLFVAGARLRSLVSWVSVAVVAAGILAYMAEYRRNRLLAYLDPWKDPLGIGLQTIQSQVGIASGGLYGVGLGAGRAKWGFLPEAQSDFIFAIVAEEVGLLGASALIGGFLLISWFGIRTAVAAPDRFGTLLAAGITSWLLVQAFLNIGMVLGVLPITGEALPFVSAGGSSLVVTLSAAGLLTSVARRVRG